MKTKKILSFILAMVMAISLLPTFTITSVAENVNANVTFSAVDGTEGYSGENYTNLFDGKNSSLLFSKWCVGQHTSETYVVIKASKAVGLTGYTFITGNDTNSYQGRNPKAWKLYGSNDYDVTFKEGTWSLISSVTDGKMPVDNFASKTFDVDCDKEYKYFKFIIEEIVSTDNNTLFQLCGMEFEFDTVNDSITANNRITLGTSALSGYDSTNGYKYVYYGTYNNSPIKWRILSMNGNEGTYYESTPYEPATAPASAELVDGKVYTDSDETTKFIYLKKSGKYYKESASTPMFLLSEYGLKQMAYDKDGIENDDGQTNPNEWRYSDAWNWCNDTTVNTSFISSSFTDSEKAHLLKTSKDDTNNAEEYNTDELSGDTFFFLSYAEADSDYIKNNRVAKMSNENGVAVSWWLRSPDFDSLVNCVNVSGIIIDDFVKAGSPAARPAFNLNQESVLFTSAVGGKKTDNSGTLEANEYKLTMLDSKRKFAVTETSANGKIGETITFNYINAETGSNEYISAMIVDDSNKVLYYGQLAAATSANGTVDFKIPSDIAYGTYELRLFNEQINDNKANISSNFTTLNFTPYGDGTSQNPWLIYNLDHPEYFRDKLDSGDTDICGKLMNDIAVNPGTFASDGTYTPAAAEKLQKWTPFGKVNVGDVKYIDSISIYAGTFDGNGKTISGLYFDDTYYDYVGLFARVAGGAEIKDLNIKNSYFNGKNYVGSVVGYVEPKELDEENSSLYVTDKVTTVSVKNCRSDAVVCGNQYVGGIVGYANLTEQTPNFLKTLVLNLQNCYNTGEVKCSGDNVGGIIGHVDVSGGVKASVKQCSNTGKVTGANNVGGILGYAYVTAVNTSTTQIVPDYSSGTVTWIETLTKTSDGSAVVVSDCYNTSAVSGTSSVGGILGYAYLKYSEKKGSGGVIGGEPTDGIREVIVSRCFNIGTVSGTENTGSISGYAVYESEGLIGLLPLTSITDCYYQSGTANAGMGYGTDTTYSKDTEAFVWGEVAYLLQGNDAASVWGQKIGTDRYPILAGAAVYEDEYNGIKVYRNEIGGYKILRLGTDSKSATVALGSAGTYAIVFADYEGGRLANVETFEVTVTKPQAVRVISDKDFTLGTGDKIMLWDNFTKLTPLCEVYEVK